MSFRNRVPESTEEEWVDPRASPDLLEERKLFCPHIKSSHDSSVFE
jgi:hypothetical protein